MPTPEHPTPIPDTPEIDARRQEYSRVALRDLAPGTPRYELAQGVLDEDFNEKVRHIREALGPLAE